MDCLALDVGGANVKFSDGVDRAGSVELALWKSPQRLRGALDGIVSAFPQAGVIVVTMTGELADCFPTKSAGVHFILDAVAAAAGNRTVWVYLVDGRWETVAAARSASLLAAASNWHALARFAARCAASGTAVLLDVGSTTCDLIPLVDGAPAAMGKTDTQRLLAGELVYTGVERSPVCAVASQVPYRGRTCRVAHELFATMRDVYLVLGELPEQDDDLRTADGRPATRAAAVARLGRMICADQNEFDADDAHRMAAAVADAQAALVAAALRGVIRRLRDAAYRAGSNGAADFEPLRADEARDRPSVVITGHGDRLARRALASTGHDGPTISLADRLGADRSRAATAYALAVLCREDFDR